MVSGSHRRQPTLARAHRLATTAVALLALAAGTSAAPARAAAPDARNQARLDRTIRFLQDVQNRDGGFGGSVGTASDPLFSAWVAIALAAGGINPRDQARPHGTDVYTYVTRHAGALAKTTDFERAALVAVAAGTSPHRFGGIDLAQRILARQLPSGAFPFEAGGSTGYVNATAFAILPLSTLHEHAVDVALARGADWLLSVQDPSGAWGYAPGTELSSDTTAAVLEALHAVGRSGSVQERRAWAYIRGLQNPDGGFGFDTSLRESNSASTAWVVQAMWAAGIDPAHVTAGGSSPLDYLATMQQPDGSIRWKADADANAIWMTAYAAPAYGGRPLPVPTVPRAVRATAKASKTVAVPAPRTQTPAPADGSDGQGGSAAQRGVVLAGGGGRGAALFSRPQPQSQGTTAGGVRRTTPARTSSRGTPDGSERGGIARGPQVTGVVLGKQVAARGEPPAAPGLLGAQAGGAAHGPAIPLALVGALLLCGGLGVALERRRPSALGGVR